MTNGVVPTSAPRGFGLEHRVLSASEPVERLFARARPEAPLERWAHPMNPARHNRFLLLENGPLPRQHQMPILSLCRCSAGALG